VAERKEKLCRVKLQDPTRRAKRVSWGGDTHRFSDWKRHVKLVGEWGWWREEKRGDAFGRKID